MSCAQQRRRGRVDRRRSRPLTRRAGRPGAGVFSSASSGRWSGEEKTIFKGKVRTDGHAIEQDEAGPQLCDGTWFSDLLVDRIDPGNPTRAEFRGAALNRTPTEAGGCQARVENGDGVLSAHDMFSAGQFLVLTGSRTVRLNKPLRVRPRDAKSGCKPV